MKNVLTKFLQQTLDSHENRYIIEDNEIYRIPSNKNNEIINDDFQIIGECLIDETHVYDEDDIFYKNTFHFYSSADKEHNIIMRESSSYATRSLFMAVIDNVKLICPYSLGEQKYSLTSKMFKYYNVFLLNVNDWCAIPLPVLTISINGHTVCYEFTEDKLKNIEKQVEVIHSLFKEQFFKDIINKSVIEMTEEEKKVISMYYSS